MSNQSQRTADHPIHPMFLERWSPRAFATRTHQAILIGIKDGTTQLAVALNEPSSRYALNAVATTARRDGHRWILRGAKSIVTNVQNADYIVVSGRTSGDERDSNGISLFLVDRKSPEIHTHIYHLIDGRSAADLQFEDMIVDNSALIGAVGEASPSIDLASDRGVAAVCAEAVGTMRAMLRDSVEHIK